MDQLEVDREDLKLQEQMELFGDFEGAPAPKFSSAF